MRNTIRKRREEKVAAEDLKMKEGRCSVEDLREICKSRPEHKVKLKKKDSAFLTYLLLSKTVSRHLDTNVHH